MTDMGDLHGDLTHEEWDELAAGYSLDALEADEELRFAEHLATCERCRSSVDDHQLVAAQLGAIAHPGVSAEPPSWAAIREQVVGEATQVVDLSERRQRRYDVSRRSLTAAAAAVVIAGGGIAIWQSTTGGSSCQTSKGCHRIELDAAGGHAAASLTVNGQSVTMATSGMTAAPSGKVYVLWQLPRDGKAEPLTSFTASGSAPVTTRLNSNYTDTTGFAVSEEPAAINLPATPSNQLATGNAV
jgi:anti-sigma-K factor RskA